MSLLEITGLAGGYGENDILRGVDLALEEGEVLTVAGTNGAGKSTLARAVMGLLPRARGRLTFDGQDLMPLPTEARLGVGIAYVPQVRNVFPSLTVVENLLAMHRLRAPRQRLEEIFALFPALAERRQATAGRLSGGERQQLAIARALMVRPRLMILDEPTAALAPALVAEIFACVRDLPRLGVTVLMVEQRARPALAVSTRGCILDQGRVAMLARAEALLADERAASLYLGSPVQS